MNTPKLSSVGRRHALLVARARRLARPRKDPPAIASITCLVCEAAGELFALPIARATHVAPFIRAASVPTSNPALIGVVARAGVFYHVYDLTRLVGAGKGEGGHMVMLRGSPAIALRVDEVLRVADLVGLSNSGASQLQANHPAISGFAHAVQADVFNGRTISLIDPDKLASDTAPSRVEGD
ncbi:MAG: chemotaxis protein CheW [Burkholderiales bacterium]|nr:MAG: chemotaxis protein CheW [Burkholderiales bacterium]